MHQMFVDCIILPMVETEMRTEDVGGEGGVYYVLWCIELCIYFYVHAHVCSLTTGKSSHSSSARHCPRQNIAGHRAFARLKHPYNSHLLFSFPSPSPFLSSPIIIIFHNVTDGFSFGLVHECLVCQSAAPINPQLTLSSSGPFRTSRLRAPSLLPNRQVPAPIQQTLVIDAAHNVHTGTDVQGENGKSKIKRRETVFGPDVGEDDEPGWTDGAREEISVDVVKKWVEKTKADEVSFYVRF